LEDLSADGRIILKMIVQKYRGGNETSLIWHCFERVNELSTSTRGGEFVV